MRKEGLKESIDIETEVLKNDFYGLVYEKAYYKLMDNEEYVELETKISKIMEEYPNIITVIEDFDTRNKEFTKEEIEKLTEYLSLKTRIHDLELEEIYRHGFRDAFQLLKKTEVI